MLLVVLLLLLVLLLMVATEWLLQGGCRASFPLVDPLLHRRLVRLRVTVRRGVGGVGLPAGFAREGTEVGRLLAPALGILGVKVGDDAGGGAWVFGLADAGTLAPAAYSGVPGSLEGRQGSGHDAEEEEPRRPGPPSSRSQTREPEGGAWGGPWR